MKNASFADYHIYSMRDRPPPQTILVPPYEERSRNQPRQNTAAVPTGSGGGFYFT